MKPTQILECHLEKCYTIDTTFPPFLNLLWWHQLTKLYSVQVKQLLNYSKHFWKWEHHFIEAKKKASGSQIYRVKN